MMNFNKKKMLSVVVATSLVTATATAPAQAQAQPQPHTQSQEFSLEDLGLGSIVTLLISSGLVAGIMALFFPELFTIMGDGDGSSENSEDEVNNNDGGSSSLDPEVVSSLLEGSSKTAEEATPGDFSIDEEIQHQLNQLNEYRRANGLSEAVWDQTTADAAKRWSKYLASHDDANHTFYEAHPHEASYVKGNFDPAYNATLPQPKVVYGAENVMKTSLFYMSNVMQSFKNSPGHNKNLLIRNQGNQPLRVGIAITNGGKKMDKGRSDAYYIVYKLDPYDRK